MTVMITGASSGFGESTARLFAKYGARLVIIARRKDRLEKLAKELYKTYQTESFILPIDITDFKLVEQSLNNLPEHFAIPNILINNAGMVRGMDKLWEINPHEWNEMLDLNVKGVLNMTRLIVPKMLASNRGHVINVGSTSSHGTYPGGGVYCASKYALKAMTDTLRMELIATPVQVSMISPGMAETEFSIVRFSGDKEKAHHVYDGIEPLTAEDIAEAILFIASRPSHVNIADIVIYPKNQASPTMVHRKINNLA